MMNIAQNIQLALISLTFSENSKFRDSFVSVISDKVEAMVHHILCSIRKLTELAIKTPSTAELISDLLTSNPLAYIENIR